MELLDKLKKSKIEIKPFGKITKCDIKKIEEFFDVVLPNDYKKFLLKYNGGAVKLNEFNKLFLDDANETVSIDVLYGIHTTLILQIMKTTFILLQVLLMNFGKY